MNGVLLGMLICILYIGAGPRNRVIPAAMLMMVLLAGAILSSAATIDAFGLAVVGTIVLATRTSLVLATSANDGGAPNRHRGGRRRPGNGGGVGPLPAPAEADRDWWQLLNEEDDDADGYWELMDRMRDRLEAVYGYRPNHLEVFQYFLQWDPERRDRHEPPAERPNRAHQQPAPDDLPQPGPNQLWPPEDAFDD